MLSTFPEPAKVVAEELAIPKTYVLSRQDVTFPRELGQEMGRRLGGEIVEIDAGHDAMLSRPAELARLLSEAADGPGHA